MAELQTTTLRPGWRLKISIIIAVLVGFSLWCLYDATIAYPDRGMEYAEYMEREYLQTRAAAVGRTLRADDVGVTDPVAELDRLRERRETGVTLTDSEAARKEWLRSLAVVGRLDPQLTGYAGVEPQERLNELQARFGTSNPPKRLSSFDIPVQWVMLVIAMTIAMICFVKIMSVRSKVYKWDPERQRLIFPDGLELTPDDLADVDKRLWRKFYVDLEVRDDHPQAGGKTIRVDLYRRAHIEDWILEMERTRFPERAEDEAEGDGEAREHAGEAGPDPDHDPDLDQETEEARAGADAR